MFILNGNVASKTPANSVCRLLVPALNGSEIVVREFHTIHQLDSVALNTVYRYITLWVGRFEPLGRPYKRAYGLYFIQLTNNQHFSVY